MSEKIMDSIREFNNALMNGDVAQVLSFFVENATLIWGPFVFSGIREIENWVKGLFDAFPNLNLRNKGVNTQENNGRQNLIIEVMLPNESIAKIPCVVLYEVRNEKINRVVFNLSYGYVTVLRRAKELHTSKT